eukprot:s1270_g19.t1
MRCPGAVNAGRSRVQRRGGSEAVAIAHFDLQCPKLQISGFTHRPGSDPPGTLGSLCKSYIEAAIVGPCPKDPHECYGYRFSVGPLVPFLCGSWLGYTLSSISFWRSECSTARGYVRDYPRLLEYVIRTEFPWARMPEDIGIEKWMQGDSLIRLSWCILAGQSCQSLIQEHQEEKRRELLAEPAE